jgi:Icc-related predicted phosphoesterase
MIIDCISDLHGYYPELEGGDLLIVAGDLTAKHTLNEFNWFSEWIREQDYEKKVVVAGNHDSFLKDYPYTYVGDANYLCDSGTEFQGMKIWGTPWTLSFSGINKKAMAFTCPTEAEMRRKFQHIPENTNILVSHSPADGCLDGEITIDAIVTRFGSTALEKHLKWDGALKLHVCGHIHEGYGEYKQDKQHSVNASLMNKYYEPVNKPIRVIL